MPSRAFTLIEVLVVVAIIAMLISVLLPSLSAARKSARIVACRANVHQMGIAMTMYTGQHGYFPGHHLASATATDFILWPIRLMRFMKGAGASRSSQYQVYWCPDSKYKTRWDGKKRLWYSITNAGPQDCANFDYGYNDWGVSETFSMAGKPNLGLGGHIVTKDRDAEQKRSGEVRFEKVKRPGEMIAIADNDADDLFKGTPGNWDTAIDPIDDSAREWPGARHNKGANVLWTDGHADFQLQARLVDKSHAARRRWNNDFRAHCQIWGDAKHTQDPEENKFNY
jgi:prepilin-type N-terminal cleavage/methylation domain-containing protein/prepilin-type processing-associated H-X9-DG protein